MKKFTDVPLGVAEMVLLKSGEVRASDERLAEKIQKMSLRLPTRPGISGCRVGSLDATVQKMSGRQDTEDSGDDDEPSRQWHWPWLTRLCTRDGSSTIVSRPSEPASEGQPWEKAMGVETSRVLTVAAAAHQKGTTLRCHVQLLLWLQRNPSWTSPLGFRSSEILNMLDVPADGRFVHLRHPEEGCDEAQVCRGLVVDRQVQSRPVSCSSSADWCPRAMVSWHNLQCHSMKGF